MTHDMLRERRCQWQERAASLGKLHQGVNALEAPCWERCLGDRMHTTNVPYNTRSAAESPTSPLVGGCGLQPSSWLLMSERTHWNMDRLVRAAIIMECGFCDDINERLRLRYAVLKHCHSF